MPDSLNLRPQSQSRMDLTKAQRLLNKIQAFLDNGNTQELSRLEKDLIKSYIQQLYDVVAHEADVVQQEPTSHQEVPTQKIFKEEPSHKEETPVIHMSEIPKTETFKSTFTDYSPPPPEEKPEVQKPIYREYSPPVEKEREFVAPEEKQEEQQAKEDKANIPFYSAPVKETFTSTSTSAQSSDAQEGLHQLFDLQKSDDSSARFGHVLIPSIESAMGLNERIFTLNELFGGDKVLFDAWCTRLNNLNSFTEARNVLIAGPAKDFKWADPQRLKMAEQFIRIVHRRYPKSVS